jgi:hypothetical protein
MLSSTLLPDTLVMYLCKLCTPDHREIFLSEEWLKKHLETHSSFFLKRWKEYTEIQCRICEDVIEITDFEQHVEKYHPVHMFADINDEKMFRTKIPNYLNSLKTNPCLLARESRIPLPMISIQWSRK